MHSQYKQAILVSDASNSVESTGQKAISLGRASCKASQRKDSSRAQTRTLLVSFGRLYNKTMRL